MTDMTIEAAAPENAEITPFHGRMAMIALMSASVLATLDTSITNTSLPRIAADLQSAEALVIWVANAYQIAMIAALLPFASLGESIGYRKVYLWGLVLFTIASLVCGMSDSLAWLVAGRTIQGIGGAAIMSVSTAFIKHIYPPRRLGRGLSMNALVVAVAFTLGPLIASGILSFATWHMLFLINIPVASLALILSSRFLPHATGKMLKFDRQSALLCAGFLGLLGFGLCSFESQGSLMLPGLAIGGCLVCLLGLLKRQARHLAPILAVDLICRPVIGLSSLTSICAFATQGLAFVSLPFFLQGTLGMSLVSTGFLLTPWPVVVAAMAVVASPLSDRFSPGVLCSVGMMLLSAGMLLLATLAPDASHSALVWRLVLCGAGFGLFQAPNMKAIMGNAPADRSGSASGIVAISRLLGQTLGAALVAQCFHLWQQQGPEIVLWLGCASAGLGCVFSALRLKASPLPRA